MAKAFLILKKDLLQEFRTRYAVNAILLFAVVTLAAVSFSIGVFSAGQNILAALLWIIIFFSSMSGLSHIFVREEEMHTSAALKLSAPPASIFLGKLFFNIVLLTALEIVIVPLFIVLMGLDVKSSTIFIAGLVFGSIGLSAGGTMVAAIISKSSSKGALFTVLSFPILLPVLISGINAAKKSLQTAEFSAALPELQTLVSFDVVIITASLLLFDFVWNE